MNSEPKQNPKRFWYALYTRARFEKKVDKELTDANIETFLPIVTVTRLWSDRKKRVEQVLFPSYLFVHADLRERYDALQPEGAVRMVSFNGNPARIPEEQIESVRRILDLGYVPTVHYDLKRGTPVEVIAGPLLGLRGIVSEPRGNCHFVIHVDGIRQSVAIKIDAKYLKAVEPRTLTPHAGQHMSACS